MRKIYNGVIYHRVKLPFESSSEYYMSRENKVIRVKNGIIYEYSPKIHPKTKIKYLEATKTNDHSKHAYLPYTKIYATLFLKGQKKFRLVEIEGIPTWLTEAEYNAIKVPTVRKYKATAWESMCTIKRAQLPKLVQQRSAGKTLKQLSIIYKCDRRSISRALKRASKQDEPG